jgi:uncharacterized membrane protein
MLYLIQIISSWIETGSAPHARLTVAFYRRFIGAIQNLPLDPLMRREDARGMMKLRKATLYLFFLYSGLTICSIFILGLKLPYPWIITPLSTLLAFGFAFLHAGQRYGWKKAALLLVIVFLTGLTFESIGVATGLVYGPYHYTDKLGPMFLNLVPYLIPIAWFMMIYPSLVIAEGLFQGKGNLSKIQCLAVSALSGVIMTAWDMVMDPVMVLGKHWIWEVEGPYFGIPIQNFVGWWLTTTVSILLFYLITAFLKPKPANTEIPARWSVLGYLVTGGSTIMSAIIGGLDGPALIGVFVMLPWIILGWKVYK